MFDTLDWEQAGRRRREQIEQAAQPSHTRRVHFGSSLSLGRSR